MSKENNKPGAAVFRMAVTALLSAMAIGLFYLEFPVFAAASHLKLDFSDFPALFAGMFIGPGAGVAVELIKNLVELLTKGLGTQMGFGNIMNFAVGVAYILPVSLLYRSFVKRESVTKMRLSAACAAGMLSIIAVGLVMNYLITPLFFRFFLEREITTAQIIAMLGFATGINAIKGAMLSAGTVLLAAWRSRSPKAFTLF